MNEINRNFSNCDEYSDQSFTGQLHEEATWCNEEYFKLENYLYELADHYREAESLPKAILWRVMRIFSYTLFSISCHFDPNDVFTIEGLNREEIYDRRERFQLMFEGFFSGTMPDKNDFDYSE